MPAAEPLKEDLKSYYGPGMRMSTSLPPGMTEAICPYDTFRRCFSDPGESWDECGDVCGGRLRGHDSQLIWARRMGGQYVVYRNVNGFNIDVELLVLKPVQDGFKEVWGSTIWNRQGAGRRRPEDLDDDRTRLHGQESVRCRQRHGEQFTGMSCDSSLALLLIAAERGGNPASLASECPPLQMMTVT